MTRERMMKIFGADNAYNRYCEHLQIVPEGYKCKIKMDMEHCGNLCIYATNTRLTNTVDRYGRVNGVRK